MLLSRRTALAMGGSLLAGCATNTLEPGRTNTFDWTLHRPEEAGVSAAGLEAVRATIRNNLAAERELSIVLAVARRNKLIMYEAFGVRDPVTRESARLDDIHRMMSTTKEVTAIAVLMMADAGRLDIDDPVSRYFPTFAGQSVAVPPPGFEAAFADPSRLPAMLQDVRLVPAARDITVRDLLTHTSGLGGFNSNGMPLIGGLVRPIGPHPGETLADYVPRLGGAVLDFQPGEHWAYSGLAGPDILLRIVEIVSGQSADVFLRERLFEPLDMHDTYFQVPPEKQDRIIPLYERRDGAWQPGFTVFGGPTPNAVYPGPQYFSGAAGLFSTAHDFMQLHAMLYHRGELNGRRILSSSAVAEMSRNQVGDKYAVAMPTFPDGLPRTAGMGFGFQVSVTLDPALSQSGRGRGSFGWDGAAGTDAWVDPEHDLFAAYFVQQSSWPARTAVQRALRDAIIA
jgi:CubicO group peptidase (beta-lactamase class C family)